MGIFEPGKVFVIAEVGGNHEGDFDYARRLLHLAAETGADAVKFQVYTADTLVSPRESPDRHRHFRKFELTIDQYAELAETARALGVIFMASVWNRAALARLDPYLSIHKIGSGDLTTYEMIEATVRTGKPIVLSCGLATMEEIEVVVRFIESLDKAYITEQKLCLVQCTSMYPIPDRDANLNSMLLMRERTGLPVGYSDHTVGTYACEIAVAMGARVIEKHFTDRREGQTFRDHQVSLTRDEVRAFVERIGKIRELQGAYDKRPMPSEIEAGHVVSFRRAVYPSRKLVAGTVLTREDVISLRPNVGIDGRDYFKVLGKRLKVDKRAYERLSWDDLE